MKRIYFLHLASCFLVLGFMGCGPKSRVVEKPTITIWHWMTDRQPAFEELAKRYEQETGFKVNFGRTYVGL